MTSVICDRCGHKYDNLQSNKCPDCNSKMKRPKWERDKVWITKNFYVASALKFESDTEYIPNISNFYFDPVKGEMKRNKIILKNPEKTKEVISALNQIMSKIGWKSHIEYLKDVEKEKQEEDKTDQKISELMKKYPSTILSVLEKFDPNLISDDANLSFTKDLIQNLNTSMYKTEESVKQSFKNLLKKLTPQDASAMDELAKLLETSSLLELTSVSRILLSRLNSLEIFEEMIMNENTYEVRGDNSIQSKLENNMWILNEEWWLVQANTPLKKFIGDEAEKDKGKLRPDFVCVSFENKLIIVDIKRPSHIITKEDIDQVENYKIITKEYKGDAYKSVECFLVGKKIPTNARNIANERKNIKLMTYTDLTEDVKKKYIEYLKALEEARKKEKK